MKIRLKKRKQATLAIACFSSHIVSPLNSGQVRIESIYASYTFGNDFLREILLPTLTVIITAFVSFTIQLFLKNQRSFPGVCLSCRLLI